MDCTSLRGRGWSYNQRPWLLPGTSYFKSLLLMPGSNLFDSGQPHNFGREIGSETQRESGTVPHYVGRARKNVKKKTSPFHMGEAAIQHNRLRGTDWAGGGHHQDD